VINGSVYLDPSNELVSCAAFAALNNDEISSNPGRTRGAYNVLQDPSPHPAATSRRP
jgi:hypothetical protein